MKTRELPSGKYWTIVKAAKFFGVPYANFYFWMLEGYIPRPNVKIGKRMFYGDVQLEEVRLAVETRQKIE